MAEQLKLFPDDWAEEKKDPTVPTKAEELAGMKQLEKYATQPDSRGAWKKFVKANEKAEAEEKALMQFAIERSNDKVKSYPKTVNAKTVNANAAKPRIETMSERIERQLYMYGDADAVKPKHYDDPMIVDEENFKQPPKEFKSEDSSTYPADRDQRQRLSTWDLMVQTAKTPLEKKEIREVLHRDYKSSKGKNMSDKELRMIGKHPDQLKKYITPVAVPAPASYVPPAQPQIPIEEIIRRKADANLRQQQMDHDFEFGVGGLASLSRPK